MPVLNYLIPRICALPSVILDFSNKNHSQNPINLLNEEEILKYIHQSDKFNSYLSLEPGLIFFSIREGGVSYTDLGNCRMMLGGVHSQKKDILHILKQFIIYSSASGLKRVFSFPVHLEEIQIYQKAGFKIRKIGSEAVLKPKEFNLIGKQFENLRQMVNRSEKRFQMVSQELFNFEKKKQLEQVYQSWLRSKPGKLKLKHLIGTPSFENKQNRRYFFSSSSKNVDSISAFCSLTPSQNGNAYALDVIARNPLAPPGTNEHLLVKVIQQLAKENIDYFSLGSSPLVHIDQEPNDLSKFIMKGLYSSSIGNTIFPFKNLFQFKNKFCPQWQPVYMAFWPTHSPISLYQACRIWGLFGAYSL